jgi:glycosyltransferase involved in cell wall biosynthesis
LNNLNTSKLISVVVPCFNQSEYLEDALNSVLAQTYNNWECIIINDGSTDQTEEISQKYLANDVRFKYIYKLNGGLSSARNAGINVAKGEYVLPLDADDVIHSSYIELAINSFYYDDTLALVYCKAKKFGYENKNWDLDPYFYNTLLLSNCIFCSAVYRRSSWENSNGYDEQLKNGWEDWDFWIGILTPESKIYQIQEYLFYYRTKPESMLRSMSAIDQEAVKWHIYKKYLKAYELLFESPITIINKNLYFQNHLKKILSSKSYRLGNLLLKPFSFFKAQLKMYSIKF